MAEPLFRFLLARPPIAQDPANPSISLSQTSDFQKELNAAAASPNQRGKLNEVAKGFISGASFIKDTLGTPLQKQLDDFGKRLDGATTNGSLALKSVNDAVNDSFNSTAQKVVDSDSFKKLVSNLQDSVLAIKFVQDQSFLSLEKIVKQLRDVELLQKVADENKQTISTIEPRQIEPAVTTSGAQKVEEPKETVPTWQVQVVYKIGDQANYEGINYVCIQAHTSLKGWEPPYVPALWVRVIESGPGSGGGSGGSGGSTTEANLFQYRNRSIQLPFSVNLSSILAPGNGEGGGDNNPEEAVNALIKTHQGLVQSVNEIMKINPTHFQTTEQVPHDGIDVDDSLLATTALAKQIEMRQVLRGINVDQFKAAALRAEPEPSSSTQAGQTAAQTDPLSLQDVGGSVSALGLTTQLLQAPQGIMPGSKFTPGAIGETTMRLQASAPLSESTKATLSKISVDPTSTPTHEVVRSLNYEIDNTRFQLEALAPSLVQTSLTRVGQTTVVVKQPLDSKVGNLLLGYNSNARSPILPPLASNGSVPNTIGKASSIYVADLLVVKQQLKGYEAADIAHIENVLRGESKDREHTVTNRTEATNVTETEVTTTDEHELASTSRYEMSKETTDTIKEDQSLKAGLQITAKYGTFVEVSASMEGSTSSSKEEVNKTASKFAQDVTERTSKKITERTLTSQTITTLNEVVEKNTHGLNNTTGTTNISGVYQWVNKIYEAQVFNYGLRTMFDFMLPEPASFLINAMTKAENAALAIEKPMAFTLTPNQITEQNYPYWVLRYQATDIVPPPEPFLFKADAVQKESAEADKSWVHAGVITIESGYEAIWGAITVNWTFWNKDATIDASIGNSWGRITNGISSWTSGLSQQTASLSWGAVARHVNVASISVQVQCRRTDRAMNAWKAETHAKLLNAYNARMQDYEDKLSTAKLQNPTTIQGQNPTANLATIKQELKKSCIEILTAQHYDLFNAIDTPSSGLSQINLTEAEAEGAYVKFFEESFEWDQIMYITYPYFWGSKQRWTTRLAFSDPDPVFDEFLKAGFCRVVVPARPGFENAVDHFLQFGTLWNGGPLPGIHSPPFLPIADEIAERAQRPGNEIPQGEAWTVRIPTELVKLRQDDSLPKWLKLPTGEWVPAKKLPSGELVPSDD